MAKSDVLNLVQILSNNPTTALADATAISNYYDDIVSEWGMSRNETLTSAEFVRLTGGQGTYTYPATALRILGVLADTGQLDVSDIREAEVFSPGWRSSQDNPKAWLVEQESRRQFAVVPIPFATGADPTGITPFDATYPAGNLTVVFNEQRTDVNPWEELVLALEIITREFARDSDHKDLAFVEVIAGMRDGFKTMIGMT